MKIYTTKDLIEQKATRLVLSRTISQHLYNEGNNERNLDYEKKKFLHDLIDEEIELIKVTKHYPINDIQDIDLETDLIVIKTKDLYKILENI